MSDLDHQIKQLIITTLDLEDISVDDIDSEEALFVEGLGLDSIDALELGLALQREFGVKMDADSQETKKYFANVNSLVKLVESQRA
ncbi:Acyl carrier protein [Thalassocella blandensis]|nr:Acyl carrier protein [Thalassocella blandensis]